MATIFRPRSTFLCYPKSALGQVVSMTIGCNRPLLGQFSTSDGSFVLVTTTLHLARGERGLLDRLSNVPRGYYVVRPRFSLGLGAEVLRRSSYSKSAATALVTSKIVDWEYLGSASLLVPLNQNLVAELKVLRQLSLVKEQQTFYTTVQLGIQQFLTRR